MNIRDTADARRFRNSLAASVVVNGGLLLLAGWLDHVSPVHPPLGRPHLKMVTFSVTPSPLASARQGVAAAAHLASPGRRAAVTRQTAMGQMPPPIRYSLPRSRIAPNKAPRATQPRPILRIVTTQSPSVRLQVLPKTLPPEQLPPGPWQTENAPRAPVLNIVKQVAETAQIKPALQPKPSAARARTAVPAVSVATQEASRGVRAASGAGWTGGAGSETSRHAGGPFGIGNGLAAGDGPRHIVYVLDISGSMGSRIARADEELETALRELRPDETFNIIAFSGGSRLFDPDMAEVTPGMVQKASVFLHGSEIGGDTNLEGAVTRALMLRDVNEVVVLTDGVPTVGETDFSALARLIRQLNLRHARICTIGLVGRNADGTDNSFEAATLLQEIARDSGGTSKLVPLGIASR